MLNKSAKVTQEEALNFHSAKPNGKLAITLTKPMNNAKDLSMAYSPGVGYPCLKIKENPDLAYEYTSKGNFVAVVSNGTAVLGYGDLGHLASKPVMEGKAALMKRFAGVDSIDLLVKTKKPDEVVMVVSNIADTYGALNLEDIKAPECFEIEERLQEMLNIPIFHDDQHGTATVTLAGIINAAKITGKNVADMKFVINGAGAAGIASAGLLFAFGVPKKNIIICDTSGIVYKGRSMGMNKYKEEYANDTSLRTLLDACNGADVLIGLSVKGAFTPEMITALAKDPFVFAMANPDPEILPEEIKAIRSDAIVATGRSDYPNQVNNLLCFPYLFRAVLDVRASKITKQMLLAAANAIASVAMLPVEDSVQAIFDRELKFGSEYIVPTVFDSRLLVTVATAVAKVAIDTGIASRGVDLDTYGKHVLGMVNG